MMRNPIFWGGGLILLTIWFGGSIDLNVLVRFAMIAAAALVGVILVFGRFQPKTASSRPTVEQTLGRPGTSSSVEATLHAVPDYCRHILRYWQVDQ